MNKSIRIEHYLLQLDRELHALPVSQRAEIITEIKSHIYDVMEKDPEREVDSILNALGTAAQVGERYLAAKGLVRSRPPQTRHWVRGLAIAALGMVVLSMVVGATTVWYLSPLLKVDEANGRVLLFGGLIDVNEKIGRVRVGGLDVNDALKEGVETRGEEDLSQKSITMIKVPFNTAKLEIVSNKSQTIKWDCKAAGNSSLKTETLGGILTLNLDSLNLAKCLISLPKGIASEFRGVNGHMEVEAPADSIDIALTNGKVNIRPDLAKIYDFEVKVKNGLQDFFPPSSNKDAVKVKVNVVNGLVNKE